MSAPMGVPPQRIQSARGPSKAPPLTRNQSEIPSNKLRGASSSTGLKSALVTSKSIEKVPYSRGRRSSTASDNHFHGLGKTDRVLATNSRIKKDELNRIKFYLTFVNSAFQKKSEGDSGDFNEIIAQFVSQRNAAPTNSSTASSLRLWISALSHIVSQFDRQHSLLVETIVNMSWTTMDATFVKAYIAFMGILVSAKTEFLSLVLSSTIQRMTYHSDLNTPSAFHPETSIAPITRRIVYDRLHSLLQHLITVIPTLPSQLAPLILRNFPHKRLPCTAQTTYIRNVLRLSEYCPQLTPHILSIIVERALAIDVEIQMESEELEEMDATGDLGLDAVFDPFDSLVGQDGDSEDSEDEMGASGFGETLSDISSENDDDLANREEDPAARFSYIRDMAGKLDAILKVIFGYLRNVVEQDDALGLAEDAQRNTHFNALINIFQSKILKTFKSRYTQFLLFWFASVKRDYADMFLGVLVTKALGNLTPASEGASQPDTAHTSVDHDIIRCTSASYVGSFVSRAAFIDAETTRHVVYIVCEYLDAHLSEVGQVSLSDQEEGGPSDGRHAVFYALCQALFLIFCFRWRDLEVEAEEEAEEEVDGNGWRRRKRWLKPLDVVQRMIVSELNPLMICSPGVVRQFAKIAQHTGFVYCYTILKSNRRATNLSSSLSNPGLSSSTPTLSRPRSSALPVPDNITTELSTFFPFDPYRLPQSCIFVDDIYRDWASVAIDEDSEDEDSMVNEVDRPVYDGDMMAISGLPGSDSEGSGAEQLSTSLGGMSISPARGMNITS